MKLEHRQKFTNEDGTELEFSIKNECLSRDNMRKTLSFIAQSSQKFYLETANKINNTL